MRMLFHVFKGVAATMPGRSERGKASSMIYLINQNKNGRPRTAASYNA